MRITEMDTLYAYNWWATTRVLDAASGLSNDLLINTGIVPIPHGSLRGTLVHMLDTERDARIRLSRHASAEPLDPDAFESIEDITRSWRAEAAAMNDYLSGLLDENMDSEIALTETERYPYWQLLIHVMNHSTQHRSEAAILLTALDRSPGDLDFALFLRESR
jgi:uncharacterized damage-inducible protein DinB